MSITVEGKPYIRVTDGTSIYIEIYNPRDACERVYEVYAEHGAVRVRRAKQ